jgi:hypothetical protein
MKKHNQSQERIEPWQPGNPLSFHGWNFPSDARRPLAVMPNLAPWPLPAGRGTPQMIGIPASEFNS